MKYSDEFRDLVLNGDKENYIGLGNPNSKILIIGKEAAIDPSAESNLEKYHSNAKDWHRDVESNNPSKYSIAFMPPEQALLNNNHTWQKYQLLHDRIYPELKPKENYYINFVENIFTTEMSNFPSPKTADAQKNNRFKEALINRKKTFFNTDFIKNQFDVVIIAGLGYIRNHGEGETREIDNIFGVSFIPPVQIVKTTKGTQSFWVHMNEDKSKLVIQTRQFSNGISNALIYKIAETINTFLTEKNKNNVNK
jgi:hypothetical protein